MRATLRRSCDSCAKAKHRCDLHTPRCSRCIKKRARCVYANEPLTSSSSSDTSGTASWPCEDEVDTMSTSSHPKVSMAVRSASPVWLVDPANASYDPFDSYPATRLPRLHVQRLIRHCSDTFFLFSCRGELTCLVLSSIAFQYYPLDMNSETNPFIVSWWPLALEDPALFHVSLQTASLDQELRAQRGFAVSEALMVDSVSELRKKIEHSSSAVQDETINAVVTLAAIEHGKGNFESSVMHIKGVKKMISLRGGIGQVKHTSPLTARMVLWVSMLVTCQPQFGIHDHVGGDGILSGLQWQLASAHLDSNSIRLYHEEIDPNVRDALACLRYIFHQGKITTTELHDLTCFVIHKLLSLQQPPSDGSSNHHNAVSESLRHALVLYLLIIHGTTYYSHLHMSTLLAKRLRGHLQYLPARGGILDSLKIWAISIGMVSSFDPIDRAWFASEARSAQASLGLNCWDDVVTHLEHVLWFKTQQDNVFWSEWRPILSNTNR
ncbi:hypothetical protein MAC_06125 [Metarhizium acridum CQMa 102]|uniref:Zn(2)-C6 fungal-type domain-containing protein n=1 Tax=Metarhizium acridum (strain CQMa 102) TaxID=655827 RepID=E9E8C7_METAQ|nr:uncharacterized protein MAC_06125 [Metarhizium acridum CQMa 102]EFY87877.1 hypothetical protein MAC_06125 [Metarhizium acridum CQMa 102]